MGFRGFKPVVSRCAPEEVRRAIESFGVVRATVHTPVYTMHKCWIRTCPVLLRHFNRCNTLGEILRAARCYETIVENGREHFRRAGEAAIGARRAKDRWPPGTPRLDRFISGTGRSSP